MSNTKTVSTIINHRGEDEVVQKSYQFVAISSAIAIQDAVDNLRSINTICTTAIGAALAQAIEHPSSMEELQKIITTIQDVAKDAITNFEKINNSATASVNNYPKGQ